MERTAYTPEDLSLDTDNLPLYQGVPSDPEDLPTDPEGLSSQLGVLPSDPKDLPSDSIDAL